MGILDDVRQIISKQIEIPVDSIGPESRLEEIGVESLDVIENVFALEEKYHVSIPFDANASAAVAFETVGQIVAAVETHIAPQPIQ